MAEYLRNLGGKDLNLIFQFAHIVFAEDVEAGIEVHDFVSKSTFGRAVLTMIFCWFLSENCTIFNILIFLDILLEGRLNAIYSFQIFTAPSESEQKRVLDHEEVLNYLKTHFPVAVVPFLV